MAETGNERRDERGFFSGAVFTVALLFLLAWLKRSGLFAGLFGPGGLFGGASGSGSGGPGSYGGGVGAGGAGGAGGGGGCCTECEDPNYPPIDFPQPPPQKPVLGYAQSAWASAPSLARPGFVQPGDPRLVRNSVTGTAADNLGRLVIPTADNTVST